MKSFAFHLNLMLRNVSILSAVLVFTISYLSCGSSKSIVGNSPKKPKNIILLIGDGMGLTQISTLFMQKDNTNNFKRFKHIGFINTPSGSDKITDSAAGATAFACGVKTYNNSVGMGMDSLPVTNLVELFTQRKYKIGMIATSSITHATPASFFAHTRHRSNQYDIADQLLKSDVDFFAGGGSKFFSELDREANLYNWVIDSSECCTLNASQEVSSEKKYGYLLSADGMPKMSEQRGDFLTRASLKALEYFNDERYFLMVEGSQIDWGGHDNDYDYVVSELKDFDQTIGAILDFAEKDKNTLVIVTSDHETGGLSLGGASYVTQSGLTRQRYNTIEPSFNTGGHTAALIPVFAFGPGAEEFQGVYENNEIFDKIKSLMK